MIDYPLISVLIPAFNSELYIKRCIESVLNQTYTNWEMIVIDDGSSDGTAKMLDYYAFNEKRIKVFHRSNKGLVYTTNELFSMAKGKYFFPLDSDNWIEKSTLFYQISEIIKKDKPDIVQVPYLFIKEGEELPYSKYPDISENMIYKDWDEIVFGLNKGIVTYQSHACKAFRSSLLPIPYCGNPKGADTRFFCALLSKCNKITCLSNSSVFIEVRNGSVSNSPSDSGFYFDWILDEVGLLFIYEKEYFLGKKVFPQLNIFIEFLAIYVLSNEFSYSLSKKARKIIWKHKHLFNGLCTKRKLLIMCKIPIIYRVYRRFHK